MPGKTARALCPVCQEPMPPDETECENCGAFVIDEAVVRLCRALGIPREKALALFEKGFRNPKQLQDRDVDDVLKSGENGLLFLCTNCGGFVATGDPKCPRCGAEFEPEPVEPVPEKDILDITLCPVCGADNEATWKECEICGEPLGGTEEPPGETAAPATEPQAARTMETPPEPHPAAPQEPSELDQIDDILRELDQPARTKKETKIRRIAKRAKAPKPQQPASYPRPSAAPAPPPAAETVASAKKPLEPPRLRPIARPPRTPIRPVPSPRTAPSPPAPDAHRVPRTPRVRQTPRRVPRRRSSVRLPSELTGGLLVAAAGILYVSNLAGEPGIAWSVAAMAGILAAYLVATGFVARGVGLPRTDAIALLVGAILSSAAPVLHQTLAPILSVSGALGLAFATRRLLASKTRDLIVAAAALPLVALALVEALGFPFAGSAAWTFGLVALTPWPAAVVAEGVRQRRSGLLLGRELTKAETHLRRQDYAASVQDFDRAIAVAGKGTPGEETPWYGKGASLVLMGRYEEALRVIDKALDLNPRNEVAWLNKGNALTKMGRLIDALRSFNAALKVNPRYEVAWNNKGNTLARLGHFEEALACYDRALEIDPGYRGAWVNKGYVLTKLGRYDEATSCADRALRLNDRAATGTG